MTSRFPDGFVSRAQARRDLVLAEADRLARAARVTAAAAAVAAQVAHDRANPPLLRISHPPYVPSHAELAEELAGCRAPHSLADIGAAVHLIQVRHLRSIGAL